MLTLLNGTQCTPLRDKERALSVRKEGDDGTATGAPSGAAEWDHGAHGHLPDGWNAGGGNALECGGGGTDSGEDTR